MDIKLGSVVKSKAGRDKDTFLVVVELSERFAFVCDGDERPLDRPKKKNLIHLAPTHKEIPVNEIKTNRELKKLLREFNSKTV